MWKIITIAAALASSVASEARRPELSWLIAQGGSKPVLAQVWSTSSSTPKFVWRVLSAKGEKLSEMPEPGLAEGYEFSYGECMLGGEIASDVIAEIKVDAGSPLALEVRRAWTLDPTSESFKESDPQGLTCYNADYGF